MDSFRATPALWIVCFDGLGPLSSGSMFCGSVFVALHSLPIESSQSLVKRLLFALSTTFSACYFRIFSVEGNFDILLDDFSVSTLCTHNDRFTNVCQRGFQRFNNFFSVRLINAQPTTLVHDFYFSVGKNRLLRCLNVQARTTLRNGALDTITIAVQMNPEYLSHSIINTAKQSD